MSILVIYRPTSIVKINPEHTRSDDKNFRSQLADGSEESDSKSEIPDISFNL